MADTNSANVLLTNASVTDLPSFNVSFFLRMEGDGKNPIVVTREHFAGYDENNDSTWKDMANYQSVLFQCYHQNLLLGNGSFNTVQREQIMEPKTSAEQRFLQKVVSTGTLQSSYVLRHYEENMFGGEVSADLIKSDNIGLYNEGFNTTGVVSFLNANVAVEQANGLNIALSSHLKAMATEILLPTGYSRVVAYVTVTPTERTDLLSKVAVNMTDETEVSNFAHGDMNAVESPYLVCKQSVLVLDKVSETSDFDVAVDVNGDGLDDVVERSIYMNIVADMYRSASTTLVAPLIVLNKLNNIENVKRSLLQNAVDLPFDSNVDIAKHFVTFSRITYKSDEQGGQLLYNALRTSEDGTQRAHNTIIATDPAREITYGELNGANAYTNADVGLDPTNNMGIHYTQSLSSADVGHDNVRVETLVYLTSLLENVLLNKSDLLTNVYWNVNDQDSGNFIAVPASIISGQGELDGNDRTDDWAALFAYRKGLASTLFSSIAIERDLFVDTVKTASVPPNFIVSGEVYDGFGSVELLRLFGKSLNSKNPVTDKYPILVDESKVNEGLLGFLSINHDMNDAATKYDYVSISFLEDYFGSEYLTDLRQNVVVTDVATFKSYARTFVSYVSASSNAYQNLLANNAYFSKLHTDMTDDTMEDPLQKYSLVLINALHCLINMQTLYDLDSQTSNLYNIQPTTIISSNMISFKNKFETIPITIEMSVRRLPRNLLKETTSLQLRYANFVNNAALRNAILDAVGNPINLLLPVVLQLKTTGVEVTERKDFELTTDYLLDCLNNIDMTKLSNAIWYTKTEVGEPGSGIYKRSIVSIKPGYYTDSDPNSKQSLLLNNVYQAVTDGADVPVNNDSNETWVATELYNKLMGAYDANNNDVTIGKLLTESDNGVLRLSDVHDDTTARGQLGDWRYHGKQAGIFAENVPSLTGGFGMQVLRWIKSGLVNKPEDDAVIANQQAIVDAIRNNTYTSNGDGVMTESGFLSPINYINSQLAHMESRDDEGNIITDGLSAFQVVLDHIYANDIQRLIVNEKARDATNAVQTKQYKEGQLVTAYMLPLIAEDTISLVTTVNGNLVDGNSLVSGEGLADAIREINNKLNKPLPLNPPDNDPDELSQTTLAITGHAVAYNTEDGQPEKGSEGVYYGNVNILVAPKVGPWEKHLADTNADGDLPADEKYDAATYQQLRERSWTIRYNLEAEEGQFTDYATMREQQFNEINPVTLVQVGNSNGVQVSNVFKFDPSWNAAMVLTGDEQGYYVDVFGDIGYTPTVGEPMTMFSVTLPQNADYKVEYNLYTAFAGATNNDVYGEGYRFQVTPDTDIVNKTYGLGLAAGQALSSGALTTDEVQLEVSVTPEGLEEIVEMRFYGKF